MKRISLVLALLIIVALSASLRVIAQTPITCDPEAAMSDVNSIAALTGDPVTDMGKLTDIDKIIQAQLTACKGKDLTHLNDTPTPTVEHTLTTREIAGVTATARAENRLATAVSVTATADFLAQYKPIDRRELIAYPDRHKGERVKLRGAVFSITDETSFQIFLEGSDDAVVITTSEPLQGVYKNSFVTVYGIVSGTITFHNPYGAKITQPSITDAFIKKQ